MIKLDEHIRITHITHDRIKYTIQGRRDEISHRLFVGYIKHYDTISDALMNWSGINLRNHNIC